MRRKAARFPGRFDLSQLDRVRSIREFDDAYTAPLSGFGSAARYYELASAIRGVTRIRIPTLIIAAENDPFVPTEQHTRDDIRTNPNIRVTLQRHGGHCGFVGKPTSEHDGYWAEQTVVNWLTTVGGHGL